MSDEQQTPPEGGQPYSTQTTGSAPVGDSWQDVGQQFQALGQSLAQAVRTAWENEETQKRVQEMRVGLEAMARDVGKAIDETANSPQGQKVRQEAERTAGSLRTATEQTVQEVRPQIISALEQLNNELQKLINRMGQKPTPPPASGDPQDPQI